MAIDEAQFFDSGLPKVCNDLANQGYQVIVAGLGFGLRGRPFGPMPELLALAEEVTKLHAVCVETGRAAHFSHRIAGGKARWNSALRIDTSARETRLRRGQRNCCGMTGRGGQSPLGENGPKNMPPPNGERVRFQVQRRSGAPSQHGHPNLDSSKCVCVFCHPCSRAQRP